MRQTAGIILAHQDKIFYVRPTGSSGWGIPKGGVEPGESLIQAAIREFEEETGIEVKAPKELQYLEGSGDIRNGKPINAFIMQGDGTERFVSSNLIASGFRRGLPENQEGQWFTLDAAITKCHKNQLALLRLYSEWLGIDLEW